MTISAVILFLVNATDNRMAAINLKTMHEFLLALVRLWLRMFIYWILDTNNINLYKLKVLQTY